MVSNREKFGVTGMLSSGFVNLFDLFFFPEAPLGQSEVFLLGIPRIPGQSFPPWCTVSSSQCLKSLAKAGYEVQAAPGSAVASAVLRPCRWELGSVRGPLRAWGSSGLQLTPGRPRAPSSKAQLHLSADSAASLSLPLWVWGWIPVGSDEPTEVPAYASSEMHRQESLDPPTIPS